MKILDFLRLNFLPQSADLGLLLLRAWLGLALVSLHGWSKIAGFSKTPIVFPDPLGVGAGTSLAMAVFAEVVCALLIVLGLFTRFAAVVLVILMSVAFFLVHKADPSREGGGELALLYLAGFLTLLITGPGRFSLDAKLGKSPKRAKG